MISLSQARALADKVIQRWGEDMVYPAYSDGTRACYYGRGLTDTIRKESGQPPINCGCLVGEMWYEAGYDPSDHDSETVLMANGDAPLPYRFDREALIWVSCLQRRQDLGDTWGEAFRKADRFFGGDSRR